MKFQVIHDKDSNAQYLEDFSGMLDITHTTKNINYSLYNKHEIKASEYNVLFMNTNSSMLANPLVRKSIYIGMNTTNNSDEDISIKKPLLFDTKENSDKFFNINDAKELLYKSGWQIYTREFKDDARRNIRKEKLSLRLITIDEPKYIKLAKRIKKTLSKLGIYVVFAGFNPQELSSDFLQDKNYDLLLIGVQIDDKNDMFPFLHSSQIHAQGGLNLSNYENLEVDLLLEDYRMATDDDRKFVVQNEITKRIYQDVPIIFISQANIDYYLVKDISSIRFPCVINNYKDRFYYFDEWNFEK